MDSVFFLGNEVVRAEQLRLLIQHFGATYICLWSYHPSNFLYLLDGFFQEESNPEASSSSGSPARRLFDEYRREVFFLLLDNVPGLAFKNNRRLVELNESNLRTMASIDVQRRFYQEARIKTAAFMGCKSGEIELGWSMTTQIINMDEKMKSWFPEDLSGISPQLITSEMQYLIDPNLPPSSYAGAIHEHRTIHESLQQKIAPSTTTLQPFVPSQQPIQFFRQAMQAFARVLNIQLPDQEREEGAIVGAILKALTFGSGSTTSSPCSTRNTSLLPYSDPSPSANVRNGAFEKYRSLLRTNVPARASMVKRAITYYRNLNIFRRERMMVNRPTSTPSHHVISERKRREKINESFLALQSLLPPETKKDKASILTQTREYLKTMKDQIGELIKRNQELEARLLIDAAKEAEEERTSGKCSNERLTVEVTHVASRPQTVELQVKVRGDCPGSEVVTRILGLLEEDENVKLTSMEVNASLVDSTPLHRFMFRLQIDEKEGWDESGFQEAIRGTVGDVAR